MKPTATTPVTFREASKEIEEDDLRSGRTVSYLEELGEAIALLSAQQAASALESLTRIREFDENEGWATAYQGFLSCAHWLSWRTGLDPGAAREKVRVANALGRLPLMSAAMPKANGTV